MWREMVARLLQGGDVVIDPRIKVSVPQVVENQAQVPIAVDARALGNVAKLIVFADLNPIQHVLTLEPVHARPRNGRASIAPSNDDREKRRCWR